ncbi:MAG: polysaccharide biosynthesis protein [Elusimicrobia bacterium]|nr:polysaccharide biosynthesis protein [Elusimicrobiota bacterium]
MPGIRISLLVLDLAVIMVGFSLAFLLRFEFSVDPRSRELLWSSLPLAVAGYLVPFKYLRLYSGIWRYSSFTDLVRIIGASSVGLVVSSTLILFVHHGDYPRSVLLISHVFIFLGVCGTRFAFRFNRDYLQDPGDRRPEHSALIVGAGDMGESILRQALQTQGSGHSIAGFVDDDPAKWSRRIHDVPIFGGVKMLPELVKRFAVDEVIIAINARKGDIVRAVADALIASGSRAELKIAPTLNELLRNPGEKIVLRKVRPADLLGREEVRLDEPKIARFISGKSVLVTGAGGTIGQELCLQVMRYGPAKVVLLDSHATSLFYSERTLKEKAGTVPVVPVLGSTQDRSLLDRVFVEHKPELVLHAAAHKHLPQLETNVHEAVMNNFLATYYAAEAAHRHQALCFLLISTDKAVRPSSVMGATKRAAEMAVQAFAQRSMTRFLAVRFGNVLGSSGSVLKLFQEQIEKGGPITLTHPDMKRYFMTVEEAVQLILQACTMSEGGEVFMLEMGESVRILDMAKNLILLSGLKPEVDIRIQYTGIRPGEKMEEDLSDSTDDSVESGHPQISILRSAGAAPEVLEAYAKELESLCQEGDERTLIARLRQMIPTFLPASVLESTAQQQSS